MSRGHLKTAGRVPSWRRRRSAMFDGGAPPWPALSDLPRRGHRVRRAAAPGRIRRLRRKLQCRVALRAGAHLTFIRAGCGRLHSLRRRPERR